MDKRYREDVKCCFNCKYSLFNHGNFKCDHPDNEDDGIIYWVESYGICDWFKWEKE